MGSGFIGSGGIVGRAGTSGTSTGNKFNLWWTGAVAQLWVDTTNIGNITVSSDRRLKHDIQQLPDDSGLEAIERLNPISFFWNDKGSGTEKQFGFIAQEVREIFPDLVRNTGMKTRATPDGMLHLEYNGLIAPIVKAIQELKSLADTEYEKLSGHDKAIARLETENRQLKQENASIKAYLCGKDPIAPFCQ